MGQRWPGGPLFRGPPLQRRTPTLPSLPDVPNALLLRVSPPPSWSDDRSPTFLCSVAAGRPKLNSRHTHLERAASGTCGFRSEEQGACRSPSLLSARGGGGGTNGPNAPNGTAAPCSGSGPGRHEPQTPGGGGGRCRRLERTPGREPSGARASGRQLVSGERARIRRRRERAEPQSCRGPPGSLVKTRGTFFARFQLGPDTVLESERCPEHLSASATPTPREGIRHT